MLRLLAAMAVFVGGHFLLSSPGVRPRIVARTGEPGFRVVYSLVATIGLVWAVLAWRRADYLPVWDFEPGIRHLAISLMLPVAILFAGSVLSRNPSAVGASAEGVAPYGIFRITRHPMMWAFGLWGLIHMAANGDLASLVFFGGFAFLALAGSRYIDRKKDQSGDRGWPAFKAVTSWLPFRAIVQKRQPLVLRELLRPVLVGIVLWIVLLLAHPWITGMPVLY